MDSVKSKVVTFIGYFYLFGVAVLLITLGTAQSVPFNIRLGIPQVPELLARILLAVVTAVITYGYLKRRKWGYWGMIIYSALFLAISLTIMKENNVQPFISNALFSLFVLIYTSVKRKEFV